ncbi:FixH family protein [Bacillus sp. CGMCC 1.16541]|uniref:FixH family protein n=1 Tax=Bacillus sp. CGMCC 1.16541 TaxID=2185143 RepID=UPI0013A5513E|nr:FixH family protein [Bacillus sp. CGMCC 1.16541]
MVALSFTFLTACGQDGEQTNTVGDNEPKMLEVNLSGPENANVNEEVAFKAAITYGTDPVNDADEVQFEVWENSKKEDSEIIEAKHEGDGVYSITKAFETEGVYTVQSHVTAKSYHNMPKTNIVIGNPSEALVEDSHSKEAEHHHHGASISLTPNVAVKGEETILSATVKVEEQSLPEADVRFEIWKDGTDKHDWVNAVEQKESNSYDAPYTFGEEGTYYVQVHVENDAGLHEHTTIEVSVK